jgi:DNA polymerase-1
MYRDVERYGMPLNQKLLKEAKLKYKAEEKRKLALLNSKHKINWNSASQLQKLLYTENKLPVLKLSKETGNPSADAKTLKRLAAKGYELPTAILDYKATNTIIKMFLNRWEADSSYDGRIHPSFGLTNVRTGRTSCSNPNLQQVPRLSDIRSMFRPKKGRQFFEADYSQLELRIAAHYANEPTMLAIYKANGDIHTETARSLTTSKDVTKEDRNKAKPVNFGFLYGMGAKGFVDYAFDNYGQVFTQSEAQHYRDIFFAKYSRLLPWHDEMAELCEALGGVENLFGRFRALPLIYSSNRGEYFSAVRRAINTPVQSSGSDLLVSAATQLNKEFRNENVHICCTVHDSIIGEFDEGDEDWLIPEIKRIMNHPKVLDDFNVHLKVALAVDVGIGPWGTH